MRINRASWRKIKKVRDSQCSDLATLIRISGLDPATSLRDQDFRNCNFGTADITGWNLCGAFLSNANLSGVKNIGQAIFDQRTEFDGTQLPDGVTVQDLVQQ